MAITWGRLKSDARTALRDITDGAEKYTDERMLTLVRWALSEIAWHTALATSTSIVATATIITYELPPDIIDSFEKTGLCEYIELNSTKTKFLEPVHFIPGTAVPTPTPNGNGMVGYWEHPAGHITLAFNPKEGSSLRLYYFSEWATPEAGLYSTEVSGETVWKRIGTDEIVDIDTVELSFPRWMEQPVVYFMAAAALDPTAVQTSDLRRWNRQQDSGNPEHNPLLKQIESFKNRARELLRQRPAQDRINYFRRGAGI